MLRSGDVQRDIQGERARVPAPKVRVPVRLRALVPRQRLIGLLDTPSGPGRRRDGEHGRVHSGTRGGQPGPQVTLVCAPAGAGKTTLLAAWAEWLRAGPHLPGGAGHPVAWVTLDSNDNDLFWLWSAILTALERAGAGRRADALRLLSPPRTAMEPGFLSAVVDAFDSAAGPVRLVLDDVHELHDPDALRSLDMLLRGGPDHLRVILATRFEPPLGLARLRLDGRLSEIHADQLTFTRHEAALMLAGHDVTLAEPDLDLLLDRTEGWAAGLRLAAMSLVHAPDRAARIAEFAGDEREVADYLVGEILSRLPDHIRDFLLATCVCDEFSVELASVLSGRDDAGEILDWLERANTLIVRLGRSRTWYRYHALLSGYLRAELHGRHAWLPRRLHRTAAVWLADHDAAGPALEHAVSAEDSDLTADLVARHGLALVLGGEGARLRRLFGRLSPDVLARPDVALVAAVAALDAGDVPIADTRLGLMGRSVTDQPTERLRALHAAVALHRARLHGDLRAALDTTNSVHAARTGDTDVDLLAVFNQGVAHIWLGDPDTAEVELRHALMLATAAGRDSIALQCLGNLGAVAASRSDLVGMSDGARTALEFAARRGWAHTSHCAFAYVLAGWGAFQRLDDAAGRYAPLAVELLEGQTDTTIELSALSLAAIVAFDTAVDRHAAVAALRAAWHRLGGGQMAPALIGYSAPYEQRMALRVGELGWAAEVPDRFLDLAGEQGEYHYLRAVLLAHRGQAEAARGALGPLLDGSARCLVETTLIDAWVLEAVLADGAGDGQRGHRALTAALAVAAPRQARRPFVEGGQPVRDLLVRGGGRFGRHDEFAGQLLAAMPTGQPGPTESLTARELATLVELPSMRTIEEIAGALHVSVNTVKTHLRGVYRKLGARSRRDAVTIARQRGLL